MSSIAFVAVVLLAALIAFLVTSHPHSTSEASKSAPLPEEVAKPHLARAEQESERVIEEHMKRLDEFFKNSKKNTRGFADDALGWGSKRRLIQDAIPFGRQDKHKEFLREKFERAVGFGTDATIH